MDWKKIGETTLYVEAKERMSNVAKASLYLLGFVTITFSFDGKPTFSPEMDATLNTLIACWMWSRAIKGAW